MQDLLNILEAVSMPGDDIFSHHGSWVLQLSARAVGQVGVLYDLLLMLVLVRMLSIGDTGYVSLSLTGAPQGNTADSHPPTFLH